MASSLLMLLDDIATLLDDVAVLSKVAAKKTAGVLGDDLALNAEQVSGVKANREIPVVWAVAKGSFLNKLILVPSALLISAFVPSLITVLMVIGGLYLSYEGFEKIAHKFFHSKEQIEQEHLKKLKALADPNLDIVAMEKDKIKGAIRTDFILSAEIIVIVLGTVKEEVFSTQIAVLSGLAILFTVGVYGLVAFIVKLDDMGLYLLRRSVTNRFYGIQRTIGRWILIIAPLLMKTLTIVGTAAMFLVGGGILMHSIGILHHWEQDLVAWLGSRAGGFIEALAPFIIEGMAGIIAGAIVLGVVSLVKPKSKQPIS